MFTCFNMEKSWDTYKGRLAAGDRRAYDSVFAEYYKPLTLYAQRFVKDRDAAEDIVQGFFCSLWENRKKLTEISAFKIYIYRAVRNSSLNYLRDLRHVSLEDVEAEKEEEILTEIIRSEVYRELYRTIQKLPKKCREIYLLKFSGYDNHEIAQNLNISESTVRSQLRHGREILLPELSALLQLLVLLDSFV